MKFQADYERAKVTDELRSSVKPQCTLKSLGKIQYRFQKVKAEYNGLVENKLIIEIMNSVTLCH